MLNKFKSIVVIFFLFNILSCISSNNNYSKYKPEDITILKSIIADADIKINSLMIFEDINMFSLNKKNGVCFNGDGEIIALRLNKTKLSNIKLLGSLKKLEYLNIGYNKISNLEGLENFQQLKELIITHNSIISVEKIKNLKLLHTLDISSNQIKGTVSFKGLNKLKVLFIFNNKLEILDFKDLSNLRWLFASNNKIREIRNIKVASKLSDLNLYGNPIYDIKDIEYLKNLKNVYIGGGNEYIFENYENLIKKLRIMKVKVITSPDILIEPSPDVYN